MERVLSRRREWKVARVMVERFRSEIRSVIRRMLKVESTPIGTVRLNFEEVLAELRKRGLMRPKGKR